MLSNNDTFLKLNDSPAVFVGELHRALIYAFCLHTKGYLTPVVLRQNVVCNDREAELIFYDGFSQPFGQQFQPILKVWGCTESSDGDGGAKVRGSIGGLSVAVFVPKMDKPKSFYLAITWQAKRILPSVFRKRTIWLPLSKNKTIHLVPKQPTALEVVKIVAPQSRFVRLWFSDIKYVPSKQLSRSHITCQDGIAIKDPRRIHIIDGAICSNSTAENIMKETKKSGLTLGDSVTIALRQYWWMASISAIIIASSDHCAGYINPIPYDKYVVPWHRLPVSSVRFEYPYTVAEDFSIQTGTSDVVYIRLKRSPTSCARLQIVYFQYLSIGTLRILEYGNTRILQFTITSEDLTSPSRFIIDLSSAGDEIRFRNLSSQCTPRLFTLESTFTQLESLHDRIWDTEAYSADISVHSSLLTHAAGLVVQLEEGNMPPVCTTGPTKEAGRYFQAMTLSGPCGYTALYFQISLIIKIHKPYHNKRCCNIEGVLDHTSTAQSVLQLKTMGAHQSHFRTDVLKALWQTFAENVNIKVNILCEKQCLYLSFHIHIELNSAHATTLAYRSGLIESSYVIHGSVIYYQDWHQVCLKHTCYTMPLTPKTITWNDAKDECEKNNSFLLSVNSDSEWTMLRAAFQRRITFVGLLMINVSRKKNYMYLITMIIDTQLVHAFEV